MPGSHHRAGWAASYGSSGGGLTPPGGVVRIPQGLIVGMRFITFTFFLFLHYIWPCIITIACHSGSGNKKDGCFFYFFLLLFFLYIIRFHGFLIVYIS